MKHVAPRTEDQALRIGCLAGAFRIVASNAYDTLLACESSSITVFDEDDIDFLCAVLIDEIELRSVANTPTPDDPIHWLRPRK